MNINALVKRGGEVVAQNQSAILTAVGVVGTAATAVLTGRASFRAARSIDELIDVKKERATKNYAEGTEEFRIASEVNAKDQIKLVAPEFIPPVMTGVATIAAIILANRVSAKNAAALAAAYGVSQREFQDYKEKIREKITPVKEQQARDEAAQKRVDEDPPTGHIIIAGGDVLCLDKFSGRYFYSTVERVKQAELKLNQEILDRLYASLTFFYDEIDLEPTDASDILGWRNGDGPSLTVSTTTTKDNRPCIVFSWDMMPYPDYDAGMH